MKQPTALYLHSNAPHSVILTSQLYNGRRLFNGRRIDLDALASQAQSLWRTRAIHGSCNASLEWLSRAVLLALFSVIIVTHDALMQFNWRALPSALLPFAVVALAGLWLRRMNAHITRTHLPHVTLPFEAAPLLHRLQLNVTAWLARAQALLMILPLPQFHLNEQKAVQTVMLLAQRMSHDWLTLRAIVEAALERIFTSLQAGCDWISFPLQALIRTSTAMTRAPRVIALRC